MRIDYVNKEIMDDMLHGWPMPKYDTITREDGSKRYIVSTAGLVAYVLEEDEICFNLARCTPVPGKLLPLREQINPFNPDNLLEPTLDIRVAGPDSCPTTGLAVRLLARFKGAAWDTLVNMDMLEAFDDARYYQAKKEGPIAVVEDGDLVGYVMPCKTGSAAGHYTDSPSAENQLIEDEEE